MSLLYKIPFQCIPCIQLSINHKMLYTCHSPCYFVFLTIFLFYCTEMSSLETYPGFNPSIKLTGIDEEKILKPNKQQVGRGRVVWLFCGQGCGESLLGSEGGVRDLTYVPGIQPIHKTDGNRWRKNTQTKRKGIQFLYILFRIFNTKLASKICREIFECVL